MDRAFRATGLGEKSTQFYSETLNGKYQLKDLSVNVKTILN
jgi:hypothetical protein